MTKVSHDTLVRRLAMLLVKLNQGQSLEPRELAKEFGVNLRTVQRDLNERFGYLPLEKVDGRYRLDPAFLGRLGLRDIERFAVLAGVHGLFPSLSEAFLRDIFDWRMQGAWLVKGHQYEKLDGKEQLFQQIEQAIVSGRLISFSYRKEGRTRHHAQVQPYRLVNHKGIWYLFGVETGKLKTFAFSKIEKLLTTDAAFTPDANIEERIVQEEGIWVGESMFEVVLKVSPSVADYFTRRKVIANQVIVKKLDDGGLIVAAKVGHVNQILPHVRYWLPNVRIISPAGLQQQLEAELVDYLSVQPLAGEGGKQPHGRRAQPAKHRR